MCKIVAASIPQLKEHGWLIFDASSEATSAWKQCWKVLSLYEQLEIWFAHKVYKTELLPHVGGSVLEAADSSLDPRSSWVQRGAARTTWDHKFAATPNTSIKKKGQQQEVCFL